MGFMGLAGSVSGKLLDKEEVNGVDNVLAAVIVLRNVHGNGPDSQNVLLLRSRPLHSHGIVSAAPMMDFRGQMVAAHDKPVLKHLLGFHGLNEIQVLIG